jgi:hypothetical protein
VLGEATTTFTFELFGFFFFGGLSPGKILHTVALAYTDSHI